MNVALCDVFSQLSLGLCFERRHIYISFPCPASGGCFDCQQYQAGSKGVEEVFKGAGWPWRDTVCSCLVGFLEEPSRTWELDLNRALADLEAL